MDATGLCRGCRASRCGMTRNIWFLFSCMGAPQAGRFTGRTRGRQERKIEGRQADAGESPEEQVYKTRVPAGEDKDEICIRPVCPSTDRVPRCRPPSGHLNHDGRRTTKVLTRRPSDNLRRANI
ncbi:hypothetical protein EYF80_041724 [Liparis tanakae]|uniref:Uncharacterized protein n=1 Tax=Liparis tanakae TaxID=230148 RepID=A0A4Z2G3I9_9TELE|nr:hypothetical protein EYF80_041724 [Liparis tanakae]